MKKKLVALALSIIFLSLLSMTTVVAYVLGYSHPTYDSIMTQPIPSNVIAPLTNDKQLIIDLYTWHLY